MPVKTQNGGVIAQFSATGRDDGVSQVLHRFPRMSLAAGGQDRQSVDCRGVAFEHAVGEEHQPVAGLPRVATQ